MDVRLDVVGILQLRERVVRDVPLQKVFRGCIPFVGVLIVGAAIMTILPQIALWLPNLMLGD